MVQKINIDRDKDAMIFDDLALKLELESDGKKGEILSGNIERFELEYHPYGFDAMVHFSVFDDPKIAELFAGEKPIDATFSYQTSRQKKKKKDPTKIKGIVWERTSKGIGKEGQEKDIWIYKIRFSDCAKVSWSAHFPYKIYLEKTLKDVIDEEKNALINLEYDFEALTEEHPILAFALDYKKDRSGVEQPNFYHFLMWLLHLEGGVLEYNYKDNKYKILGKKSAEGDPIGVAEWWVTPPVCTYPNPARSSGNVIKHAPDKVDKEEKEEETAFKKVLSDSLDSETYLQFPEQNDLDYKGTQEPEKATVHFTTMELTEKFHFEHLFPGKLIAFKGEAKKGRTWSENALFNGKTYRLNKVSIKGEKTKASEGMKSFVQHYEVKIDVEGEDKEETFIPRPSYVKPVYPFSILGKVFCEIGDEEQTTYNVVKDEKAPLGRYEVLVPIGGEEKKVIVPFSPDFMTGQHYFPFCRDQHVMLDMHFRTGKIKRVVNWQPLTELPEKIQGCQVVYGSNGKDKYFYQKHEFVDGKDSVMTIKQSSSETQTQVIEIKEKIMTFTVEEKDKRKVMVQFDRDKGLLLQVEDKEGGITNQTEYTEKEITHTSKGGDGTSTIVQKPDAVEVECKKFTVKCEESLIDAKKTITNKAGSKVINDTPVDQSTTEATIG